MKDHAFRYNKTFLQWLTKYLTLPSAFLLDSFRPLPVAKEIVTTIFQRFRTNAQCLPLSFRIASGSFRWPLKTSMCKTKAGMSIPPPSGYLPVASGAAAILIVLWQIYSSWFQDSCRPYWGVISNAPRQQMSPMRLHLRYMPLIT